ncbi:BAG family molecular chaperone regulator 2 [Spatholobus suberectus]|nr:BAG family molecular chaperone regulator 2 [Spatholobus suberectus]
MSLCQLDQLADQVSAIEKSISNGVKVPEVQITTLIEMLMRQAIKLESISAEGDASAQKNLQGKRVQKCVETLDQLKVSNARISLSLLQPSGKPLIILHPRPRGNYSIEFFLFFFGNKLFD